MDSTFGLKQTLDKKVAIIYNDKAQGRQTTDMCVKTMG